MAKLKDSERIPPKAAQNNARRGLELRSKWNRGGTSVGVARARDISNSAKLSDETIKRMASFNRHRKNYQPNKMEPDGGPTAGTIAWLLWGGTTGIDWAIEKSEKLKRGSNMSNDAAVKCEDYEEVVVVDELKKFDTRCDISLVFEDGEFSGKIRGKAAPIEKTTDDSRNIKFSREFLQSNLNKKVPMFTDHEQKSRAIVGKAEFNQMDFDFLYFDAELYLDNPTVKDFLIRPLKDGILKGVSVGLGDVEVENDKGTLTVSSGDIIELSLTPTPAFKSAEITSVFSVVPFQDLPMPMIDGEIDFSRPWNSTAAVNRVRSFFNIEDNAPDDYKKAFLWYDSENKDNLTAYKLPIADIVDGKLVAIPRAIFAASAAISGARGGVNISQEDKNGIVSALNRYYKKMDRPSPFENGFSKLIDTFDSVMDISTLIKSFGFSNNESNALISAVKRISEFEDSKKREKHAAEKLIKGIQELTNSIK